MNLKIAIIGSGPSAFYTAQSLLKQEIDYEIDIIEKLFSPYGLIRYGVAPDHQSTKNVTRVFERVLNNPKVEFFGAIEINNSPSIDDLMEVYDAVVIATGMAQDKKLNINEHNKDGYYGATQFVNWYNGHPEYENLNPNLNVESAIIIGNGNVAIDCARLLVKTTQELEKSDITKYSIEALEKSAIKNIYIVGRRGPLDSKFTTVEIREMAELLDCDSILSKGTINNINKDLINEDLSKQYRILTSFPENKPTNSNKTKTVEFKFHLSPTEFIGEKRITGLKLKNNISDSIPPIIIEAGLVISAIGYTGDKISGVKSDELGKIIHKDNIVKDRLYTAGWVSRGPSGVIGTNKHDGANVANHIRDNVKTKNSLGREGLKNLLNINKKRYISKEQWFVINQEEIKRSNLNSPRLKFTSHIEVFKFLDSI
jgi:NADPH-dependent glutamate synthase beta subunit-like oxidoreductase